MYLEILKIFGLVYINKINELSKESIDLSFMNELLGYIDKDECCIPHNLLVKYGVFKERDASHHIKQCLEEYGFIVDEELDSRTFKSLKKADEHIITNIIFILTCLIQTY